ncbi:MAG: histidine phosphatase family protein [Janthinobacterium lividum]
MNRTALVRHGETAWNLEGRLQGRSDIPLNDTGREQARGLAATLGGGGWTVITSSPLSRARETAQIVAVALGLPLLPAHADLTERDFGLAEGGNLAELRARYPHGERPESEPWPDVVARGAGALRRLRAEHGDADLIVVCHGSFIRAVIEGLTGVEISGVANASATVVLGRGDDWRLEERIAVLG